MLLLPSLESRPRHCYDPLMSTHNYSQDIERMEAREKIKRLEWELACEKEWTEKL